MSLLDRDNGVKNFCGTHRIEVEESIGQTLWDPLEIINANGGVPPLSYGDFCHVTQTLGLPKRPVPNVNLKNVEFLELENKNYPEVMECLTVFSSLPTPQMLGIEKEDDEETVHKGGELLALRSFNKKIKYKQAWEYILQL